MMKKDFLKPRSYISKLVSDSHESKYFLECNWIRNREIVQFYGIEYNKLCLALSIAKFAGNNGYSISVIRAPISLVKHYYKPTYDVNILIDFDFDKCSNDDIAEMGSVISGKQQRSIVMCSRIPLTSWLNKYPQLTKLDDFVKNISPKLHTIRLGVV